MHQVILLSIRNTSVDAEDIRITLKGLEYLSENSIMQKMYKTAKGITDLIPQQLPPVDTAGGIFVLIFRRI